MPTADDLFRIETLVAVKFKFPNPLTMWQMDLIAPSIISAIHGFIDHAWKSPRFSYGNYRVVITTGWFGSWGECIHPEGIHRDSLSLRCDLCDDSDWPCPEVRIDLQVLLQPFGNIVHRLLLEMVRLAMLDVGLEPCRSWYFGEKWADFVEHHKLRPEYAPDGTGWSRTAMTDKTMPYFMDPAMDLVEHILAALRKFSPAEDESAEPVQEGYW